MHTVGILIHWLSFQNLWSRDFKLLKYAILVHLQSLGPKVHVNFFLENLFQILKKPFDVKKSSDSKYASPMTHGSWAYLMSNFEILLDRPGEIIQKHVLNLIFTKKYGP